MKSYIIIILSACMSTCVYSCKDVKNQAEIEFFKNAISSIPESKNYNWIVVLPELGCHGCIQEGEYFIKQNVSNQNIFYVLTNISSMKIFQQKTGIKIREHNNIYIDRNNLFNLKTNNSIYPCIIEQKDGEIIECKFQSPQSAAFQRLSRQIK